jgi:hypothetical protein
MTMTFPNYDLDDFKNAYTACLLWAELDANEEALLNSHDKSDLAAETQERIHADCIAFIARAGHLLTTDNYVGGAACTPYERAGHDFWLTRNGHGAGFWDGDWDKAAGQELTDIAHNFGTLCPYVGDDGKIYLEGG